MEAKGYFQSLFEIVLGCCRDIMLICDSGHEMRGRIHNLPGKRGRTLGRPIGS